MSKILLFSCLFTYFQHICVVNSYPQYVTVVHMQAGFAHFSSAILTQHWQCVFMSTCAYTSGQRIRFSQRWVTSRCALWSPSEWEINCQTMHSSHPLRSSSCQMISKHYRMSGCIIYRTPPPLPPSFHSPHPRCTAWWICGPATKGSIKRQDFYHHFIFPLFTPLSRRGDM